MGFFSDLDIQLCSPCHILIHLYVYVRIVFANFCLYFFALASGPKSFQVSLKTTVKPRWQTEQYAQILHPEQEQSKSTNEHPLSFCPEIQRKFLTDQNWKDDGLEIHLAWYTEGHPKRERSAETLTPLPCWPWLCYTVLSHGSRRRESIGDCHQTMMARPIFLHQLSICNVKQITLTHILL